MLPMRCRTGLELLRDRYEVAVWNAKIFPETEHIQLQLEELQADGLICLLSETPTGRS